MPTPCPAPRAPVPPDTRHQAPVARCPLWSPTPPEAGTPLLQLCPLPLAALHDVLVLLGHLGGHRPPRLPQGQDLRAQRCLERPAWICSPRAQPEPHRVAPTFRSNRSWSKASTLRLCRGRADLGEGGNAGSPHPTPRVPQALGTHAKPTPVLPGSQPGWKMTAHLGHCVRMGSCRSQWPSWDPREEADLGRRRGGKGGQG